MRLIPSLRLRGRLLAGFLLCAVLAAVSGGVGILSLRQIESNTQSTAGDVTSLIEHQNAQSHEFTALRDLVDRIGAAQSQSAAEKIRIELVQEDGSIRISVRDWGIGFSLKRVEEGHFGLQGIRERVRLFSGQITIETAPDKGTHISVELPLIEAAGEQFGP